MKKSVIAGLVCLGLGSGLFVGGFIGSGGAVSVFGGKALQNTHTVMDEFTNISMEVISGDVQFFPSVDGTCKVVCKEQEDVRHVVSVEEGTLKVLIKDERKWYDHIGISFCEMEVVVYLPFEDYENISVTSISGDIEIDGKFTFADMYLKSVSGDVEVGQVCVERLNASSTSGDIHLSKISTAQNIELMSTSGDVELSSTTCQALTAKTASGDVEMSNVISSGATEIKTVSGDVELASCDGESYSIKTNSGSVRATFRTTKQFSCDTVSGRVSAPHSTEGGMCRVETTSGNIHLSLLV